MFSYERTAFTDNEKNKKTWNSTKIRINEKGATPFYEVTPHF